jgi:hypothetical protein
MSVTNCQPRLRNNPEEQRSQGSKLFTTLQKSIKLKTGHKTYSRGQAQT